MEMISYSLAAKGLKKAIEVSTRVDDLTVIMPSSEDVTAADGQTVIDSAYTPGLMDVFLDGVYIAPENYIAEDGLTIEFQAELSEGQIVHVTKYATSIEKGSLLNVDTVASNLPSVVTVANDLDDPASKISAVADNITSIQNAEANATLADTRAADAQTYADSAALSANNKGEWDNLTGEFTKGESVTHDNSVWIANIDIDDITSSEPTDTNTDWLGLMDSAYVNSKLDIIDAKAEEAKQAAVAMSLIM